MSAYEDYIKSYVSENADAIVKKTGTKNGLIKFSEAVSRAILERKKSDTGYGDIAESLASAGLSDSGYASYIKNRGVKRSLGAVKGVISQNEEDAAELEYENRLERERLEEEKKLLLEKEREKLEKLEAERLEKEEKERLEAEKKEAERIEKEKKAIEQNKKTVTSFANANNVTDEAVLYNYAISLGLSVEDAKNISATASKNVAEKLRVKNVELVKEHVVSERFTRNQAYAYAKSLGLSESDALELAYFAYKLNQDTSSILGYDGVREPPKNQAPPKTDKKPTNKLETKTE